MLKLFSFAIALLLFSCAAKTGQTPAPPTEQPAPEDLLGPLAYQDILATFPNWGEVDNATAVDPEQVRPIANISEQYHIVVFLGTWCGDSRRGVPPFMKTLAAAGNPNLTLELIGVDHDKFDPDLKAPEANIERVPTFVIYREGEEVGRLIEFPEGDNFAADFINLVAHN